MKVLTSDNVTIDSDILNKYSKLLQYDDEDDEDMDEDDEDNEDVKKVGLMPVKVESKIVNKIIEFLDYIDNHKFEFIKPVIYTTVKSNMKDDEWYEKFVEGMSVTELRDHLSAGSFLIIDEYVNFMSVVFATHIRALETPRKIREFFGVDDSNRTDEEIEEILKETEKKNPWVTEKFKIDI